jgi:hypothetical protein
MQFCTQNTTYNLWRGFGCRQHAKTVVYFEGAVLCHTRLLFILKEHRACMVAAVPAHLLDPAEEAETLIWQSHTLCHLPQEKTALLLLLHQPTA